MSLSIYKDKMGKEIIQKNYDMYLEELPVKIERIFVETSFGVTHVLVSGPEDGKPIFLFQGGNSINPMTFSWFVSLTMQYRVYAPDTNGHPGYSDEGRISGSDKSFAKWTTELLHYFQIDQCAFIGPSFGGGIILRLATHIPDRISCAVLVAPAGLKVGPKLPLLQQILKPLVTYNITGTRKYLDSISNVMSDRKMSELDKKVLESIFMYVKLEKSMPKLTTKKELSNFYAPTMVIAGERDIFFPANKINAAACKVIPNLTVIKNYQMAHFPDKQFLSFIQHDIIQFLHKHY